MTLQIPSQEFGSAEKRQVRIVAKVAPRAHKKGAGSVGMDSIMACRPVDERRGGGDEGEGFLDCW